MASHQHPFKNAEESARISAGIQQLDVHLFRSVAADWFELKFNWLWMWWIWNHSGMMEVNEEGLSFSTLWIMSVPFFLVLCLGLLLFSCCDWFVLGWYLSKMDGDWLPHKRYAHNASFLWFIPLSEMVVLLLLLCFLSFFLVLEETSGKKQPRHHLLLPDVL